LNDAAALPERAGWRISANPNEIYGHFTQTVSNAHRHLGRKARTRPRYESAMEVGEAFEVHRTRAGCVIQQVREFAEYVEQMIEPRQKPRSTLSRIGRHNGISFGGRPGRGR
jgi:hypothetical protein